MPGPRSIELTPYIKAFLGFFHDTRYEICTLVCGTQMSKALDVNEPLPTPSGWTTMGDVQPGMVLFDEEGRRCNVVGISPVMNGKPCFRVEFCDGSTIIASEDHRWAVDEFQKHRGAHDRVKRVMTTQEIIDRGVSRSNGAARFSIRIAGPLDLPEADLPLSPYVLGVWLGDGNSRAPAITCGTRDLSDISAGLRLEGLLLKVRPDKDCWRIALSADIGDRTPVPSHDPRNIRSVLRRMGLIKNKHIPMQYLRASEAQRLALLQGLMDTDGTAHPAGGSFCSKYEHLARQFAELAASLGFRPRLIRRKNKNGYVSFNVNFASYNNHRIFRLDRKQAKIKARDAKGARPWENDRRYIQAITPVDSRPVKCIAVDSPSHLFLAGERMTPTHNTDAVLDAIGWRLDTKPRPQLYVGPSKDFVQEQFEPRLMKLFDEAPNLADRVARGKRNKKTRKMVNGVPIRLAWAGSATSLASDQAGDVYIDEYDKMTGSSLVNEGDAFSLAKARADTYADRKIVVTSTPQRGTVEIERDRATGLEFWKVSDGQDVQSPIWTKWQQGTRHHWSWKCPACGSWFVPRMSCLQAVDGEKATATQARKATVLICPVSGCVLTEDRKAEMNAGGMFAAPGMHLNEEGDLEGEPEDNSNLSLWVSGLASPFLSWGERLEEVINAQATGTADARQGAINKTGELWSPISGEVPDWRAILNRREPYAPRSMPDRAVRLTMGVDVQSDRLPFVIRAWGARAESWLVEHGEIMGPTDHTPVWGDLADLISTPIDGFRINLVFLDSGFRPGKKFTLPINRVYQFARRFRSKVFATKGSSRPLLKPLTRVRPDVKRNADVDKYGLELIRLDSDYWKTFVHERLTWPLDSPGAWHISGGAGVEADDEYKGADEDYARQLVAESRIIGDDRKPMWVERSKQNHFLDCEALAAAAAFMLNVHHLKRIKPRAEREVEEEAEAAKAISDDEAAAVPAAVASKRPRLNRMAQLARRLNDRGTSND